MYNKFMALNDKPTQKILLVDDDPSLAELFKESLEDLSFQVILASDGIEALKILDKTAIDCLITDIDMPNMNGVELVKALQERGDEVPVFIITGYLDTPREMLNTFKPRAIIFKPFDFEEASILVKNHMMRL